MDVKKDLNVTGDILLNNSWTEGSYSKIIGNNGLRFYTGGTTSTDHTLKMIVNSSGNVGIGTDNPGVILHIIKNTGSYAGNILQTALLLELKTNTNVNVSNGYGSCISWKILGGQKTTEEVHYAGYLGCYIWSGANQLVINMLLTLH